jgi:S-ribosylhomocysteine lyase
MGCLTGNYLIVKGTPTPEEICPLVIAAFEILRDWQGDVPGATAVNCGNYLLHDLAMAKWEAARFVEILKTAPSFDYPVAERIATDSGAVFYDS